VEHITVLDLTAVRFRWSPDHQSLAVLAPSGELLAVRDAHPAWSFREAALRALDEALTSARVLRFVRGELTPVRVGLYNPFSKTVAVDSLPHTRSFSDGDELSCPPAGVVFMLDGSELVSRSRTLRESRPESFAALTRLVEAHSQGF
jgi:hypothetical protein